MAIDSNELLGRALGSCTLKRLIGRGGMGAVYLAQQSRPRRTVAVKVVLPGIVLEQKPRAEFLARFRREADAIAALDHINIMPVYEYGEQGDTAYLVMPYVTGGTLRDALEKKKILALEEVVPILEQIAAALDSAHAQSIVHRDLKPGNILFHADGRVLLADFGLAKVLKDVTENESNGHLTSIGTIIGTPEYLSPEQGTGDAIDYHTDIYSLGIVIYQMLAGRVPFAGPSPVAIAIKHALEEPPPPSRFNPSIPPNVETVILKAIAKKPSQRYESAGAFALAFRQAVEAARAAAQETMDTATPAKVSGPHSSLKPVALTHAAQAELKLEEEHKTTTRQNNEGHSPTEAARQVAQVKELDTAVPTVLVKDTTHGTSTQEPTAQSAAQGERVPAGPSFTGYADATVADAPQPQELRNLQLVAEPVAPRAAAQSDKEPSTEQPGPLPAAYSPLAEVPQIQFPPSQTAPVAPTPAASRGSIRRPLWMIIAGGLLILALVAGGAFSYVQGLNQSAQKRTTKPAAQPTTVIQKAENDQPTRVNTPQVRPTANPTPQLPGPRAGVAGIGTRVYGTNKPGKDCDTQGAQWSNSDNAHLTCQQDALELSNTGSKGNQPAGTFLTTLPGNQSMPAAYVVQTDLTLKTGSQGQFGIAFYKHSGDQSTSYAFIIDPSSNTWTAIYYDANGQTRELHTQQLQTRIEGTVTIDVVVAGGNYYLYVNGTQQGTANSGYGNTNGGIGLLAGPGTTVAFKNTLLYTNGF